MSADPSRDAPPEASSSLEREPGTLIGGRYRVERLLGRGGMARVYRTTDTATSRELAVKCLILDPEAQEAKLPSLFEREYHTLVQLSHPRIVAVYDYGVDEHGAYYTMELLDGGDLTERTPCPWREAAGIAFDVASSLALVHSRRLVHGDISPRNVRCTREGHAKLIDFGAMAPMGRCDKLVGTPAFVAPEVVAHLTAEAASDLYSLGATLYYALTGHLPYVVTDFAGLARAHRERPLPPSRYTTDVPPALDALTLSLLELDPEQRPRTAFEVMQRLAAIAGFDQPEHAGVAQAYLSRPTLVGRDDALELVRQQLMAAKSGQGGGVLISGASGVGRSRMLDACVISAKTLGAEVLRLSASEGSTLSGVQHLVEQLATAYIGSLPAFVAELPLAASLLVVGPPGPHGQGARVRPLELGAGPRGELQRAVLALLLRAAQERCLVIAVDDVQRIDDVSRGLLAAVAHAAAGQPLLVIATHESTSQELETPSLRLLWDVCTTVSLQPLHAAQTRELLLSIFGDAQHLQLLSQRVYTRTQGNPRLCMDLLQHLVDARRISYERGGWTLPSELEESDLPVGDAALQQRLAHLDPVGRALVIAHALASHSAFDRADYAALLADRVGRPLDLEIGELVAEGLLLREGQLHRLRHRAAGQLLLAHVGAEELRLCHLGLARVFERRSASVFTIVKHQLAGGLVAESVDVLYGYLASFADASTLLDQVMDMRALELAALLETALHAAQRLQRPLRQQYELRHWVVMTSVASEPEFFQRHAPAWLDRLVLDSGLAYYRERDPNEDPGQRLMYALTRASQVYESTPELERVYRPEEAIRVLVRYVVFSIAVGTKTYENTILCPLPELLAPFTALSPLLHAVWQNTVATLETTQWCQVLQARERWTRVLDGLPEATTEMHYVIYIRNAISFGLGLLEARIGISTASRWVERLDADPLQAVNAMYLRKIIRLQFGDLSGAEECRKRAELLAMELNTRPLFMGTLVVELIAHAMAKDVQGVKQIRDRIRALASRFPGWVALGHLAEAQFQRLVGDLALALAAVERCLRVASPDPRDPQRFLIAWPAAASLYVEIMTDLDRMDEALALGERTLAQCAALDIDVSAFSLMRAVALTEAKLGRFESARARVQAVITQQLALGVEGMHLGASYEVLARVGALAKDREAWKHYVRLTEAEYKQGSALAARHAALLFDTRELDRTPEASQITSTVFKRSKSAQRRAVSVLVERELEGAQTRAERAQRALRLLCEAYPAPSGQLYLCDASGLTLVAEHGAPHVPTGLSERVKQWFDLEVEADAFKTQ
ncbi:MAG: protein kinase, partial [Polyangiales bacterium]